MLKLSPKGLRGSWASGGAAQAARLGTTPVLADPETKPSLLHYGSDESQNSIFDSIIEFN